MLNRLLDAVASRAGLVLTLGSLLAICFCVGIYLEKSVQRLDDFHRVFNDRQLRNGFVAMSDLQRLNLVVINAAREGGFTPERIEEFRTAADILYVRAQNFRRVLDSGEDFPSADAAIESLERIVDTADAALAGGFPDPAQLAADLNRASDETRQHLVAYLDDMRSLQDKLLTKQTWAVRQQHLVVWFNLVVLTLFGAVMMILLRREVLSRLAREKAEERVAFLAYFDPLTSLPNRVQFQEQVVGMIARDAPFALLFADLDDFKSINDTYGHAAGDAILKYAAGIIEDVAVAAGGFAARIGGDEFAAVMPGDDVAALAATCRRITDRLNETLYFDGETLSVTTSIGLATTSQVAGLMTPSFDMLSRVTDFALYASKEGGRNRFTFYDKALEHRFLKRRELLAALPGAIANGDLRVFLQPKFRLDSREVFGFEALVRWQRKGELVLPSEFVSLAEEAGLINEIDLFVLRGAVEMLGRWNAAHDTALSVSVNVSALNFASSRLVREVRGVLGRYGLAPELLILEITESLEMRDWENARQIIDDLHEIGCKIAIDDFGTGFSSLAYLRTAAADQLKIDKSLVSEVENSDEARFILDAVVDIAESLGMSVIVEGIETEEQARIVLNMGVVNAQGFLLSKPIPGAAALKRFGRKSAIAPHRVAGTD